MLFRQYLISVFSLLLVASSYAQLSTAYLQNKTLTYEETIDAYKQLDKKYATAQLLEYGSTDAGKPLHLFLISSDPHYDISAANNKKSVILINNGIHPGEPCGVDASLKLAEALLSNADGTSILLDSVVLGIIPIYNVGGSLNRGCCSRANQNGPEEYGFRGNAKNLDLNRDFIKLDSENAKTFTRIFHDLKPDIFIDTHTSNGADYQYVMTLIASQQNEIHPLIATYLDDKMLPFLYKKMKKRKYEMCPYVQSFDKTPDKGIVDFLETPRYSTGYTAMFNTISFTTETHMFKPFKDRVLSTYNFLITVMEFANNNSAEIRHTRSEADKKLATKKEFVLEWELDTSNYDQIVFKGYEAKYKASEITMQQQLYYDREAPYSKQIRNYRYYEPKVMVSKPAIYLIPQGWTAVIDRLKWNRIAMKQLTKDTVLNVDVYYIENYDTGNRPYESHYLHKDVEIRIENQEVQYYAGDYIIEINQSANRYIVETLEPQGIDSYLCWNFFDAVLQQKEWYSSYVFDGKAVEILKNNPELKAEFENKKAQDSEFANNPRAQLFFIYRNSEHYENSHNRYPVARLNDFVKLPAK